MNHLRLSTITVVFAVAVALPLAMFPRPALAQDQPKETKIELIAKPALDDRGHLVEGQYVVRAILTTADGRYVAGRRLRIIEDVEFFGQRSASLRAAATDETGQVSVTFQPSQVDQYTIVARFAGDEQYAASEARIALDATDVVPPYTTQAPPLASVGGWLAVSLGVLGVAFWTVLLGVVGRKVWLIRAAPRAAGWTEASGDFQQQGGAI